MTIALALAVVGITLRQADRWWHSPFRTTWSSGSRSDTVVALLNLQRTRRNNVTPILLLAGHWIEIAGYLLLAAAIPVPAGSPASAWSTVSAWPAVAIVIFVLAAAIAVKCRHLQEVSHFGVHTALCRSRQLGDWLIEFAAQGPLGLATVEDRRDSHVRRHHPNAAIRGLDPNMQELEQAGIGPGQDPFNQRRGLLFPLTGRGLWTTVRVMRNNTVPGRAPYWRLPLLLAFLVAAAMVGGPIGVAAMVVGRLVIYPQLAWMSLLVEHQWFRTVTMRARPLEREAARCVRLYPNRPVLQLIARSTWLPYGDLYHFCHSVYPTVRWNYLPILERIIGLPEFAPDRVLGVDSVVERLRTVTRSGNVPPQQLVPVGRQR